MPNSQTSISSRGRPPSSSAESHAAILDAVADLLTESSVRELTMEAVAKRAKVGKPTLYKWWPSKAALVFALFHERIAVSSAVLHSETAEQSIRFRVRRLIDEFNGVFGKVMAELIAEGQSDPALLNDLFTQHISLRRADTIEDIVKGKKNGEIDIQADEQLLIEAIFGPLYFRHLLRYAPLTQDYGEALVTQVLRGVLPPCSDPR